MKLVYNSVLLLLLALAGSAQKRNTYHDSIIAYQKNYTVSNEVVKAADKKFFRFYPANKKFLVQCRLSKNQQTAVW